MIQDIFPAKPTPNTRFINTYLEQNDGLGNACSIQLSYAVTSALIKYTATPFSQGVSAEIHSNSRRFTRIHESTVGRTRGEFPNHFSFQNKFQIQNDINDTVRGDSMAKRFTDSQKWRNQWFRTLPLKAKIVWVYLCDECDFAGIWKADFDLASFQVGFDFDLNDLVEWFGSKVHAFGGDNIIVVQFFEFQYGQTKDTWSAKTKARERLQSLGFLIEDNKIRIETTHSVPTVGESGTTLLCIGVGIGKGNKGGVGEKSAYAEVAAILEAAYQCYPRKNGKTRGLKKLKEEIKSSRDAKSFQDAVTKYRQNCKQEKTPAAYVKHFSTFVSEWRDWLDSETGAAESFEAAESDDFLEYMKRKAQASEVSNGA